MILLVSVNHLWPESKILLELHYFCLFFCSSFFNNPIIRIADLLELLNSVCNAGKSFHMITPIENLCNRLSSFCLNSMLYVVNISTSGVTNRLHSLTSTGDPLIISSSLSIWTKTNLWARSYQYLPFATLFSVIDRFQCVRQNTHTHHFDCSSPI